MSKSQSHQTDDSKPNQGEESLYWLRDSLRDTLPYIDDVDLKTRVIEWLKASHEIPAGQLDEHIEAQLAALEAEYKMYNHDGVDDGIEAFPDACEGCPHYGGGCPVVTQSTPQQKLKQIAEETETQADFAREIRNLARQYECHRIPEWLAEWNDRYKTQIAEGWELFEATNITIGTQDSDAPEPRVDLRADEDDNEYGSGR
jgi:hypothetical protein